MKLGHNAARVLVASGLAGGASLAFEIPAGGSEGLMELFVVLAGFTFLAGVTVVALSSIGGRSVGWGTPNLRQIELSTGRPLDFIYLIGLCFLAMAAGALLMYPISGSPDSPVICLAVGIGALSANKIGLRVHVRGPSGD